MLIRPNIQSGNKSILEFDNVKNAHRYIIVHCLKDDMIIKQPVYDVTVINMCERQGSGKLLSNYEQLHTINTYYGLSHDIFNMPNSLQFIPMELGKQYFNKYAILHIVDYNDSTRYTNFMLPSTRGRSQTKTNTRYIELKYKNTQTIKYRNNFESQLPHPKFYTDEQEIAHLGDVSDYKNYLIGVNPISLDGLDSRYSMSLQELKDGSTELLFAPAISDTNKLDMDLSHDDLSKFTIVAYGILKSNLTKSFVSSINIVLNTSFETGKYDELQSNFKLPNDGVYKQDYWINFVSTLKYMNDLFKEYFTDKKMFIHLDNLVIHSEIFDINVNNEIVNDIVMNKTSHTFSMMVNIDGTI